MKKKFRPTRCARKVDRFLIKHLGVVPTYRLRLLFIFACRYTCYWNHWPFRKSCHNYFKNTENPRWEYQKSAFKYRHCANWNDRKHHKMVFKRSMEITKILDSDVIQEKIDALRKNLESSEKTFCIVQVGNADNGLFNIVERVMLHCTYAVSKGYVPVVDMQNCVTTYLEPEKFGKENAWEYYFEQPFGYGLDGLETHGKIEETESKYATANPITPLFLNTNPLVMRFYSTVYGDLLKLNERTRKAVDEEYSRLIKPGMRVLGVSCRGADFVDARPLLHPIQPELHDVIEKVKQCMVQWNCDHIYVTCDQYKTLKVFEDAFPGKVLSVSRLYYSDDEHGRENIVVYNTFDRENDAYLRGLEYLVSIVILSRCTCLVAGRAGGSFVALYMNNGKYENKYLFELGEYGVDD